MVEIEYAKALFDLATEENKIEEYENNLEAVCNSFKNHPDFLKLLLSPMIEVEEKHHILEQVYYASSITFKNFLYTLINHNRLNIIEDILTAYQKLVRESKNVLHIEVVSAEKLTKSKMNEMVELLKYRYPQKKLIVQNSVDPDILYGIQVLCDGQRLDLSLKNMLQQMKDSL